MTELRLELKCAECGGVLEGRGVSAIAAGGFCVRARPCETCVSAAEKGRMRENRVLSAAEALGWVRAVVADLDPDGLAEFLKGLGEAALGRLPVRMVEVYEGDVAHAAPDSVAVVWEVDDDDLVEHQYDRAQFADSRLPEKGDRVMCVTCVVRLPQRAAPPDNAR